MKKKYNYRITIESLDPAEEGKEQEKPVVFEVKNHDNIFAVIRRTRKRLEFDEETGNSFALGLKLLTEVLLENRNEPLFSELKPAMVDFMRKLKGQLKPAVQPQFEADKPKDKSVAEEILGIKESVEKRIQEIEEKSIAFSEIEVSSIEEMDDDMMAEFEASTYNSQHEEDDEPEEVEDIENSDEELEVEETDDDALISTISGEFSLSSRIRDTQYTMVEKLGEDGELTGIELLEVDEEVEKKPSA